MNTSSLFLLFLSYKVSCKLYNLLNPIPPPKEKVVIIGASSGIGRELALLYAKRGSELLLVARRKELLQDVAQECLQFTSKVSFYIADVTIEEQVSECAKFSKEYLKQVDLLIISSGILSVSTFEQLALHNLQDTTLTMFKTNVLGPILLAKHFKQLLQSSKGKLCVISSLSAYFGAPTRSLYSCTKFALRGFMESLRIEWKRYGISIILISPSTVNTDFRKSALDNDNTGVNSSKSLEPVKVALEILKANDSRARHVFIPSYFSFVLFLQNWIPDIIDNFASRKYGYH